MAYVSVGGVDPLKAVQAAAEIVFDPALPRIIDHVLELNRLEQVKAASRGVTPPKTRGVGLKYIEQPLGTYVWVRKNPGSAFLAAAVILGIPLAIGYVLGKGRRSP